MYQLFTIAGLILLTGISVRSRNVGEVCNSLQLCHRHYSQDRTRTNLRIERQVRGATTADNATLLPSNACGRVENDILSSRDDVFPWLTLLAYRRTATPHKEEFLCAGTLISNRYVLTAAHCMHISGAKLPVSVRIGSSEQDADCAQTGSCADSSLNINVERIVSHAKYNKPFTKNDIALVRLATIVVFTTYIQPICLHFDNVNERKKFEIAGWTYNGQNLSPILQHSRIPGVTTAQCNSVQSKRVKPIDQNTQICAGGFGGYDACQGESGGPMMDVQTDDVGVSRTYQVGIVSFGSFPCGSRVPSVFTRVSGFRDWILSKLQP